MSISYRDFTLAASQVAYFTPDEELAVQKLLRGLIPGWLDRFDADPIILPEGAPPEIPRLILLSRSGEWRCEMASRRVNVIWQASPDGSPPPAPSLIFATAIELLDRYIEFSSARVSRLGAVLSRHVPHEKPGLFLSRHFCRERWHSAPLNRPEGFELHAHKVFQLTRDLPVNSWVRNKSARIVRGGKPVPTILVEQDLNTLAEQPESKTFTSEARARFFKAAVLEFDKILALYFPGDLTG